MVNTIYFDTSTLDIRPMKWISKTVRLNYFRWILLVITILEFQLDLEPSAKIDLKLSSAHFVQ